MEKDSDVSQFLVAFKYQLKSYIRTKRFIGLALFTAILAVGITALIFHVEYSTLKAGTTVLYLYNYLDDFSVDLIVIIAAFFGGDLISTDTGTNAAYYSLVQPVRRSVLFLGRYTAALLSSFIIVFIYFAVGIGSSFYLYGKVTPLIFNSLGILLIFLAATVAFASLFSGIFKGQSTGIIVSVLLLLLAFPIMDEFVGSFAKIEPLFSLDFVGEIVYLIFDEPYAKVSTQTLGPHFSETIYLPGMYQGIAVLLIYLIISGVLAIIIYSRRQIEG